MTPEQFSGFIKEVKKMRDLQKRLYSPGYKYFKNEAAKLQLIKAVRHQQKIVDDLIFDNEQTQITLGL